MKELFLLGFWFIRGVLTQDPLSREADPVILKGSVLPELRGLLPDTIVGFRFNNLGVWEQIPIQIDEMHVQDMDVIKNGDCL